LSPRQGRGDDVSMTSETGTPFDHFPKPPCAELLGWRLLDHDVDRGFVRIGFEGRREFLNPAGFIQGGFLTAMLDDTMGPALLIQSRGALYTVTIDMNVSFMAPAKPGQLFGEGQVVQCGKTVAFLEARLVNETGELIARATATARVVPVERALADTSGAG
jgi:uncharacterized protein (TIGR00369 family)